MAKVFRGRAGRKEAQREAERRNKRERERKKKKKKKKKVVKKQPVIKLTQRGVTVPTPKPKVEVKELPAKKVEPVKAPSKPAKLPAIKLKAPPTKDTIAQKAFNIITSPKTTGVLITALSLMTGAGAAVKAVQGLKAAKGATAVITRTKSAHLLSRITGGLIPRGTIQTQRAFIGKSAKTGVEKLFKIGSKAAPVAARYATNVKSISTSTSMLTKVGLGVSAAALTVGAIGSYPFAAFIKEEAIQTLSIPVMKAVGVGDLDTAERQIEAIDEILNAQGSIMSKIPYANVLESLGKFFEAASTSNEAWKNVIQTMRDQEAPDDKWERIYAEQDARRIAQREDDEEYWEGVQESQATAREEGREEDAQYWNDVRERNEERREEAEQEELEELAWKAEYFDLIREGKFDEAAELLKSKMKGGI